VRTSADAAMGPFSRSGVIMSNTAALDTLGCPVTALHWRINDSHLVSAKNSLGLVDIGNVVSFNSLDIASCGKTSKRH